jgi:hypothetical protein
MNISPSKCTGETSANRYEKRYERPDFNDMRMLILIFYHLEFFNMLSHFLRKDVPGSQHRGECVGGLDIIASLVVPLCRSYSSRSRIRRKRSRRQGARIAPSCRRAV